MCWLTLRPHPWNLRRGTASIHDDVVRGRIGIWSVARRHVSSLAVIRTALRDCLIKLTLRHAWRNRDGVVCVVAARVVECIAIIAIGLVPRIGRWLRAAAGQGIQRINDFDLFAVADLPMPHDHSAVNRF